MEATPAGPETAYEIVSIAGNTKYRSLREERVEPIYYIPMTQDPRQSLSDQLLIRTNMRPGALMPSLRRAIGGS